MQPRRSKPTSLVLADGQQSQGCTGCSLEHAGYGFATPSGPSGARLTIVGEALGYEEALWGEPFYGAAGGVLSRILTRAGVDRPSIRIANAISCRPPGDYLVGASYEAQALIQCRQYLQPVLDAVPHNGVVVPVGGTALGAVLNLRGVPGVAIKEFHGTVSRVDRSDGTGYWVVPTFHPAQLQKGSMNLLEIVTQDFRTADRIATSGFTRSKSELVVDPPVDWFAHWITDYLARLASDPDGVHLALDTEYAEKAGGRDEGEMLEWSAQSPITRVNGGIDSVLGWTVPYHGDYIREVERLLAGAAAHRAWLWLWNKYADLDHLQAAGHTITGYEALDAMWLWKYLQSDLPRGLGFVAPLASDFGAWKHWAKDKSREGEYAAADGVQTWRIAMWLLQSSTRVGIFDVFMRDWHDRDKYCLRPAHHEGVPVNRAELVAFHEQLQVKLADILTKIKTTTAQGVLKPKLGYAKRPARKSSARWRACVKAKHDAHEHTPEDTITILKGVIGNAYYCRTCWYEEGGPVLPPATVIGTPKKGGGEAKSQYMREAVVLVSKEIDIDVTDCATCGATEVTVKHRCKRVATRHPRRKHDKSSVVADRHGASGDRGFQVIPAGDSVAAGESEQSAQPPDGGVAGEPGTAHAGARVAMLVPGRRAVTKWFWQLPFNPDAPAQILAYLDQQGIDAPTDKKTQKRTTNKKALDTLRKQYQDDPLFALQLDWKAVSKVDSTYAVGTLAFLDKDDKVHPEYAPVPSTLRDSARAPNLTNVVADKGGVQGLASGFRRVIESRDGVPANRSDAELAAWEVKWGRQ